MLGNQTNLLSTNCRPKKPLMRDFLRSELADMINLGITNFHSCHLSKSLSMHASFELSIGCCPAKTLAFAGQLAGYGWGMHPSSNTSDLVSSQGALRTANSVKLMKNKNSKTLWAEMNLTSEKEICWIPVWQERSGLECWHQGNPCSQLYQPIPLTPPGQSSIDWRRRRRRQKRRRRRTKNKKKKEEEEEEQEKEQEEEQEEEEQDKDKEKEEKRLRGGGRRRPRKRPRRKQRRRPRGRPRRRRRSRQKKKAKKEEKKKKEDEDEEQEGKRKKKNRKKRRRIGGGRRRSRRRKRRLARTYS